MKKVLTAKRRICSGINYGCGAVAGGLMLISFAVTAADASSPRLAIVTAPNTSLRNEVMRAVEKGLGWLRKNQDTNGVWSTADLPAFSALALTAFSLQPEGLAQTAESAVVNRGYLFLLSCVQPDGGIYRKQLPSYNTSVALTALVLANRPEHQAVIAKARKFLISLQADFDKPGKMDNVLDGGIGYGTKDKLPDLSNTSLALEAMYLSRRPRDEKTRMDEGDLNWQAAIRFVQCCQNLEGSNSETWVSDDPLNKGGFIYAPGRSMAGETNLASGRVALRSYGSMSYAGLLSYIYADLKRDDPRVVAVMDWLRANFTLDENPAMGPQGLFYYYHTLAKALTVYGADTLETKDGRRINWREQLALKLINLQHSDGSWANDNGRWLEKEPVLATAYSIIALEMIYPKL